MKGKNHEKIIKNGLKTKQFVNNITIRNNQNKLQTNVTTCQQTDH